MLVLSRKIGEEIIINGNITLKITEIGGGAVRIGFEAPRDVAIDRAEIHASKNEFREEHVVEKPAVTREISATRHPAINRIRRHLKASGG